MKTLTYKINIAASRKQVWETMLNDETYKQWVAASWPGSFYVGKWQQGEKIRFVSKDGSGTLALIEKFEPYNLISATHIAVLQKGGIEDTQSDIAKGWVGTTEAYKFTEQNGQTELIVEINTNPDWEKMFNDGWTGALQQLKKISEAA